MSKEYIDQFIEDIYEIKTQYHFVKYAKRRLLAAGYVELNPKEHWETIPDKFFIINRKRTIYAFAITDKSGGVIVGSHCDSPCFKCTLENYKANDGYERVQVYPYGAPLAYSFLDRELLASGNVIFKKDGHIYSKVITTPPIGVIPNLAVHLGNDSLNPKFDLFNHFEVFVSLTKSNEPTTQTHSPVFLNALAKECDCNPEDIVDFDINFVPAQRPMVFGLSDEFIGAARIDNLSSSITGLNAFLQTGKPKQGSSIFCSFDNEEISSFSQVGAKTSFTTNIFKRLGFKDDFFRHTILASADVTHASNPNYPQEIPRNFGVELTGCFAVGTMPNYNFSTQYKQIMVVKKIAEIVDVKYEITTMDNDQLSGSTIGRHVCSLLGIEVIDLGVPVLAMHSSREMIHSKSPHSLEKFLVGLYEHFLELK